MQITHKIDDFLFMIFPELRGNKDSKLVIEIFTKYYTYGVYKPTVTVENDIVIIEIDTNKIVAEDSDYRKMITLCEKGKYSDAKPILENLIKKNPTNSEYHRIMGQILSDEGDQEEAINCLIDALRWDSKNGWALLMMGNIFSKHKKDISTAMKYYDQAVIANPKDNIAINNIGANLMQQGKIEEAKKYFWEAIKINDNYPNTHFALGLIAERENDLDSAFYSTIKAIRLNCSKDVLYQNSVKQAFEIAKAIVEKNHAKKSVTEYRHKLEFECGVEIELIEDNQIQTAAKIEFAEYYNRPKHIVRFKSDYPAVEHLIMHELVHLDFVIQARKGGLNRVFISNQAHKSEFIKKLTETKKKFKQMGISEDSTNTYCSSLFDGLNSQVYNAPIDLFIENYIYNEHPELRPYQFLSLYTMIQEGLKAVTDKKIVDLSPKDILSKSKIYNLVNAFQFKELYGLDFTNDYKASLSELNQVQVFYDEYKQYKDDKEPAEEYELVLHWAEDLKLDVNFELVGENEYQTKRTNIENLLTSIENDPYELETNDPYKEREMNKFQKSQEEIGINMAVVMYMVEALKYFEAVSKEEIKKVAFEIAMLGTQGFRPDKKDYRISAFSGKIFSGYHILAYYYVSWMLALPDMVSQLNLPYEEEFKLANSMHIK